MISPLGHDQVETQLVDVAVMEEAAAAASEAKDSYSQIPKRFFKNSSISDFSAFKLPPTVLPIVD